MRTVIVLMKGHHLASSILEISADQPRKHSLVSVSTDDVIEREPDCREYGWPPMVPEFCALVVSLYIQRRKQSLVTSRGIYKWGDQLYKVCILNETRR